MPTTETSTDMREILLVEINQRARRVFEAHRKARSDVRLLALEKRELAYLVEKVSVTPKEACSELRIIVDEVSGDKADENTQLIETAIEFINREYDRGKYEGRDAAGFFRTLFNRIEGLGEQFDERLI